MFIIRNPFVSKSRKETARLYYKMAESKIRIADLYCRRENGTYTEMGFKLCMEASDYTNKARAMFGFKDIANMDKYIRIHGTL